MTHENIINAFINVAGGREIITALTDKRVKLSPDFINNAINKIIEGESLYDILHLLQEKNIQLSQCQKQKAINNVIISAKCEILSSLLLLNANLENNILNPDQEREAVNKVIKHCSDYQSMKLLNDNLEGSIKLSPDQINNAINKITADKEGDHWCNLLECSLKKSILNSAQHKEVIDKIIAGDRNADCKLRLIHFYCDGKVKLNKGQIKIAIEDIVKNSFWEQGMLDLEGLLNYFLEGKLSLNKGQINKVCDAIIKRAEFPGPVLTLIRLYAERKIELNKGQINAIPETFIKNGCFYSSQELMDFHLTKKLVLDAKHITRICQFFIKQCSNKKYYLVVLLIAHFEGKIELTPEQVKEAQGQLNNN